MQALLSFDQAPPFSAPLRFFLTAPLFLVFAGVLLLFAGEEVLVSRWSPAALAMTHLLTVGFMLTTMIGALIQVLPVVAGANLPQPLCLARCLHVTLALGALSLAAAFLFWQPWLFVAATGLLSLTGSLFLLAVAMAMRGVPTTSPTIRGLKLAFIGLFCTLVLGVVLAFGLAQGWPLPLNELTNLHASFGLAAWAAVLLVALSYVVVPMFQLTPPYPARLSWLLPLFLFALPWLAVPALWLDLPWLSRVPDAGLAVFGIIYAAYTLYLQGQRRRARCDAPYRYWQIGLWLALLALLMALLAALFTELTDALWWAPLFGVLLGAGGFVSLLIGMLYRIVPFLAWLHLQDLMMAGVRIPSVGEFLPDQQMARQMWSHFVAVLLLVAAVFQPQPFALLAGLAWIVSGAGLLLNLLGVVRRYRHHRQGPVAAMSA